jgi:2-polyprenyl-6-methoxyphenol hydroxylase-like FAD-dependent oxidoreductase
MDTLILGGGMCGMAAAMMLARDGHDVTVLEKDEASPPASVEEAIERWDRKGVAQFRQVHYMHARFRHVLDEELPDVRDALIDSGARRYDVLQAFFPPFIEDTAPRPGDERYATITGRRPMLEVVFARKAENEPRMRIIRGTKVAELLTEANGVPHVIGVRTEDGNEFRADLIIDAMGRSLPLSKWLADAGFRPPYLEDEDSGFTYYARYFRGNLPQQVGPAMMDHGSFTSLTLPSDNDTWWVLLFCPSGDMPLKALREEETWTKVVRSLTLRAHWLDGEPISGIEAMSGVMDRYRRYVVDNRPVVTGILPLADAAMSTNPSFGRGISLGLWHTQELRRFVPKMSGDPSADALGWDDITQTTLTPWYRAQIAMDRARVRSQIAAREGRPAPEPDPDDIQAQTTRALFTALAFDADVFRAFLEIQSCLSTPEEVLGRPGLFEKVIAVADGKEPMTFPAPTREELLQLIP